MFKRTERTMRARFPSEMLLEQLITQRACAHQRTALHSRPSLDTAVFCWDGSYQAVNLLQGLQCAEPQCSQARGQTDPRCPSVLIDDCLIHMAPLRRESRCVHAHHTARCARKQEPSGQQVTCTNLIYKLKKAIRTRKSRKRIDELEVIICMGVACGARAGGYAWVIHHGRVWQYDAGCKVR